jgi:sterol 3beta-glucosyltransferase
VLLFWKRRWKAGSRRLGIQTWGSEGDVRPFLALASGLAKKGHHVTVVATTGFNVAYARIASANGFTFSNLFDRSLVIMSKDELLAACFNMSNPIRQA